MPPLTACPPPAQQKATVVPVLAGVGPLDPQSLRPNPDEVSGETKEEGKY